MSRKVKYKTEEQRKEAHRAAVRKWQEKNRAKKKSKPKSWVKSVQAIADKLEHANSDGEEPTQFAGPELPSVDIAGRIEIPPDDQTDPMASTPSAEAPTDDKPKEEPASENKDAEGIDDVGAEQLAEMGAAAWCEGLAVGTKYAADQGYYGIGGIFMKANYESMKLILMKALKDTTMKPGEYAAYLCAGSGAWVAGNCYYAYQKANPPKKTNANGVINEQPTTKHPVGATNGVATPGPEGQPTGVAGGLAVIRATPRFT